MSTESELYLQAPVIESWDEYPDFRRVSGDMICEECGKEYWRHPYSEHLDWQNYPWLHRLCDGTLIKT